MPSSYVSADDSVKGKIKYRYGLHCFGRSKEDYENMFGKQGFEIVEFEALAEMGFEDAESVEGQFLLTLKKPD